MWSRLKNTFGSFSKVLCAAGIHYRHDVQLITDNQRCEECIAMAQALLTCFGKCLAEENCFTIALKPSFQTCLADL